MVSGCRTIYIVADVSTSRLKSPVKYLMHHLKINFISEAVRCGREFGTITSNSGVPHVKSRPGDRFPCQDSTLNLAMAVCFDFLTLTIQ